MKEISWQWLAVEKAARKLSKLENAKPSGALQMRLPWVSVQVDDSCEGFQTRSFNILQICGDSNNTWVTYWQSIDSQISKKRGHKLTVRDIKL